jgi:CDP-4-dehydro-6-deoxyglucose reductase, E3
MLAELPRTWRQIPYTRHMSKLTFNQRKLTLAPHESVLDCLLRHGEALPYACKAGMCQACIVRAVDCEASEESSKWIKPALQQKGYTLACKWFPDHDVSAAPPLLADFALAATISELTPLNAHVLKVVLAVAEPRRVVGFNAGQYVTATNPHGCARAYSLANDFQTDNCLELHVARTSHGEWSGWLFNQAKLGDTLYLNGPHGTCYYDRPEDSDAPLLLAGTGTGLAPLLGIVRTALQQGHSADIHLYHGGRSREQLYLSDLLQQLANRHSNFHYHPCVKEADSSTDADLLVGKLEQVVATHANAAQLRHSRVFLSGAPDFVHSLRKKLFLQGARAEHIHCDPFTERTVTTAT